MCFEKSLIIGYFRTNNKNRMIIEVYVLRKKRLIIDLNNVHLGKSCNLYIVI